MDNLSRPLKDEEADAERQVPAKAPAVIVASDVAEGPTPRAPKPQPTQQTLQLLDRIQKHQTDLEDGYFSLRIKDGGRLRGSQADLEGFGAELTKIASKHRFRTVANLHYADSLLGAQNSIVSSIVFDKDDEFFATAGVTKKIKIFEFSGLADMEGVDDVSDQQAPRIRSTLRRMAALAPGEGPAAENGDGKEQDNIPIYPTREIQCRSKISSLSWNSFIKSHLASADYEGCVTLWDSNVGAVVAQFDEHEKRTWSVDFCKNDPVKLASGSDDAKGW